MTIRNNLFQDSGYTEFRIPKEIRDAADYIFIQREKGQISGGANKYFEIIKTPNNDLHNYVGDVYKWISDNEIDDSGNKVNILVISLNGKWLRNY